MKMGYPHVSFFTICDERDQHLMLETNKYFVTLLLGFKLFSHFRTKIIDTFSIT